MSVPRILIVDNDYETCVFISDVLSESGFRVDTAKDGSSALELVRRKRHDVALVESDLPDIDGIELFQRIRRLRPGIGAILLTTVHSVEKLRDAIDAGLWDVISKPVNENRLVNMVAEVVGEMAAP